MITSSNIIARKSYLFALEIVKLSKYLSTEKRDYILSKQIMHSGTSTGANVYEAIAAETKKDFVHKPGIALKETNETSYWLNLLFDGEYINKETFDRLYQLSTELNKIISSIILTTK